MFILQSYEIEDRFGADNLRAFGTLDEAQAFAENENADERKEPMTWTQVKGALIAEDPWNNLRWLIREF